MTDEPTIISFFGMFYHAYPTCMGIIDIHDMKHPLTGQSMMDCYKNTLAREKYLIDQGYKLIICDDFNDIREYFDLVKVTIVVLKMNEL